MRIKKVWIAVAAVPAVVLAGTGVAFAAWTLSGTGSGTALSAGTTGLIVAGVTPAAGTLFPSGPAAPVDLTINNPNPYPVNVTSITWGSVSPANTGACAATNVSIDSAASPSSSVNFTIAANTTSPTEVVPGVVDMAAGAPGGCANMTFSVGVTALAATQQP
jgi:hypothetical protein